MRVRLVLSARQISNRDTAPISIDISGPAGLPVNLGEWPNMTPGDVAAVRRKAVILGAPGDAAEVARRLVAASKAKPGRAATIGFMR